MHKLASSLLAFFAAAALSGNAFAAAPVTKRLVGTLVSPSDALAYYQTSTGHTNGLAYVSGRAPEIKALARTLGRGGTLTGDQYAQRVADYVRRNIDVEFRFGLGKGARGTLLDQSGTPFDQAQLMVELLREGGQTASYKLGTVSLTTAQFGKWTGLISGLNQSAQSFSVDAKAACQLLADGGIPATVAGASSCSGLTGNLSTSGTPVTLLHIWVFANNKNYDPSFKVHILKTGINIPSAMNCSLSCGASLETQALIGATQGSIAATPAIPWVKNVNQAAVEAFVQARAVDLQTAIEASDPTQPIEDVIGTKTIDIAQATPAALPYTVVSTAFTWTGNIPDQYRVKFSIQFLGLNSVLFADELAGRRLRLRTTAPRNSFSRTSTLFADGTQIATATATGLPLQLDRPLLGVDHPFAAGGSPGRYGDDSADPPLGHDPRDSDGCIPDVICNVEYFSTKYIILNVGSTGPGSEQHYSRLLYDHKEDLFVDDIHATMYDGRPSFPVDAANYLSQSSAALRLIGGVSKSHVAPLHFLGGLFFQDWAGDKQSYFNVQSAVVANNATSNATDASAAFETAAATIAALEGSIFYQSADAFESSASVSLFKLSNDKGRKFFSVTSTNINDVWSSTENYTALQRSTLSSYASEGFNVILSENRRIGTIDLAGGGSVFFGMAPELIASGSGTGYLIAEVYKGAGAVSQGNPVTAAIQSARASSNSVKGKSYWGLDLASGSINLKPPADVSVGSGDSALAFERRYSSGSSAALQCHFVYAGEYSGWQSCWSSDTGAKSLIGGGWTHNLNLTAKWSGSGFEGLGATSGLRASRAIASLYGIFDLSRSTTFTRRIASVFTTYSLIQSFVRNSFSIDMGGQPIEFIRLPNGRFDPPPPARGASLSLSGSPSVPAVFPGGSSVYRFYTTTNFTYTDHDGKTVFFSPSEQIGNPSATLGQYNMATYSAEWTSDTSGLKKTFMHQDKYSAAEGRHWREISGVQNSLGHSLSLVHGVSSEREPSFEPTPRLMSVSAAGGQGATFQCSDSLSPAPQSPATYYDYYLYTFDFDCTGGVTNSAQGVTKFLYTSGDGSYSGSGKADRAIKEWYVPSNGASAFMTLTYDQLMHVASYKVGQNTTLVFTSNVAGDNYRIGEVKDPSGAISSSIFDGKGSMIRFTDPLQRSVSNVYDSAGRLLRTVYPEGNAVEYTYDIRGNMTRECRIAKGVVTWTNITPLTEQTAQCSTSRDLVTTTVYMEAANLRADQCVNPKTCNKPDYVTDPRGYRTDYSWDSTHGGLVSVASGLNSSGGCAVTAGSICPLTTYGYSAYTAGGTTFYLLTSKVDRIDASNTVTTTWNYDASNKYALKEQVVDSGSGGLQLRTCFKFDAAGNLISKTDPNAGLAGCP